MDSVDAKVGEQNEKGELKKIVCPERSFRWLIVYL